MTNAAANRHYFDSISDTYDSKPFFAVVNQKVTDDLRSRLPWLGIPLANTGSPSDVSSVRQLDYACGTGLLSRVFAPYVTQTLGVDVSPNMVESYNTRARTAGLPATAMHAVVGDLLDAENPSPQGAEWDGFDLVTVGFAFHHFEDVVHAAMCMKERLRPGGVLVISDFLEGGDLKADAEGKPIEGTEGTWANHHHGHGHGHGHGAKDHSGQGTEAGHIGHHHHDDVKTEEEQGFDRGKMSASIRAGGASFTTEGVKKFFSKAGLVDVDVVKMEERVYMEFGGEKLWRTVLFARGRRPAEGNKSEL